MWQQWKISRPLPGRARWGPVRTSPCLLGPWSGRRWRACTRASTAPSAPASEKKNSVKLGTVHFQCSTSFCRWKLSDQWKVSLKTSSFGKSQSEKKRFITGERKNSINSVLWASRRRWAACWSCLARCAIGRAGWKCSETWLASATFSPENTNKNALKPSKTQ